MKISFVFGLFCCIVLACGAGGMDGPVNYNDEEAKKLFKQYCSSCHGTKGRLGLNGAKKLTQSTLNYDLRVIIITNGKGAMNGFKGIITEEEIKSLAKYSMTLAKEN